MLSLFFYCFHTVDENETYASTSITHRLNPGTILCHVGMQPSLCGGVWQLETHIDE